MEFEEAAMKELDIDQFITNAVLAPHDVVLDRAQEKYYWVLYCKRCGYIFEYGNDTDIMREQRRQERPTSCI
jgi:hypothetical protein